MSSKLLIKITIITVVIGVSSIFIPIFSMISGNPLSEPSGTSISILIGELLLIAPLFGWNVMVAKNNSKELPSLIIALVAGIFSLTNWILNTFVMGGYTYFDNRLVIGLSSTITATAIVYALYTWDLLGWTPTTEQIWNHLKRRWKLYVLGVYVLTNVAIVVFGFLSPGIMIGIDVALVIIAVIYFWYTSPLLDKKED